jgi:hypothetical protein
MATAGRFRSTREAWRPRSGTADPFDAFDGIFAINLDTEPGRWKAAQRRYRQLGIAGRVERFAAVPTPQDHHRGCALSWRGVIAEADRRGYETVLGLEDDAVFLDDTRSVLGRAVAQLDGLEWDLLYLGGAPHGDPTLPVDGRDALRRCGWISCSHALAVHRRAFAGILADLPTRRRPMAAWIKDHVAVDQYLGWRSERGEIVALLVDPQVAVQPELLTLPYGEFAPAARYSI